ncbi:MAG: fused response regulator/phosphatase [Desulfobacterales bacterium]|nr:fused response regulator/phosphatase [Desulfobacterales bacterium]
MDENTYRFHLKKLILELSETKEKLNQEIEKREKAEAIAKKNKLPPPIQQLNVSDIDISISPIKILIVDDSIFNQTIFKEMLKVYKCDIYIANNGLEGVEVFEREKPDLVIMDITMPIMDGFEATRLIKSKCLDKFVPVIVITALSNNETMAKSIECGADDFMTKPINQYVLKSKIKAMDRIRGLNNKIQNLYNEIRENQELGFNVYQKVIRQNEFQISNIKYFLLSMDMFCGDVVLYAQKPSGGLYAMLGDFTGHGLSAAIGAIPLTDIFYSMASKDVPISDIVFEINRKLNYLLPPHIFLAGCFLELDYKTRTLTSWHGGIPDAVIVGKDGGIKKILKSKQLPLGILDGNNMDKSCETYELDFCDRLYLYSDGVVEIRNLKGDMFGEERLYKYFESKPDSRGYLDIIKNGIEEFKKGAVQNDDITMLEINFDPLNMA